jgi:CHASE3 domain sensor protein
MQLDGNFYKKEVTELKPEISQRRKNIETYLITRYNMNLSFAQQITSILEKTSLDDKNLRSGMNDSVIELAIKQMTEKRTSSLNDAQHIRKQETAENVISSNSSNQTEDQDSAKIQEFEEMRRKNIEDMEKYQAESEELRAKITSRRGRK